SPAVLLAMGNWLSDKYAEGSPGHRFYAGCDNVDAIESRAVELAKSLFGAQHAYVQAHSGIDANLVAFWAVLTHRVAAPELERPRSDRCSSSPATAPTPARSTSASSARLPTRWERRSWSTWPTSPASSPARSTPATSTPSATRTS